MIEIQCTSCQTRYRIDEGILPEDTPTFKCSRCGHVFSAEPRKRQSRRSAAPQPLAADQAAAPQPAPSPAPADGAASATDTVEAVPAPDTSEKPQPPGPAAQSTRLEPLDAAEAASGQETAQPSAEGGRYSTIRQGLPPQPPAAVQAPAATETPDSSQAAPEEPAPARQSTEDLLSRRFGEAAQEATDTGENLSFDFSDEGPGQEEPGHPEPGADADAEEAWEVGDEELSTPDSAPSRPIRRIRIDEAQEEDEGAPLNAQAISAAAHRLEKELRGKSYTLHSAGFFIALFALLTFGFGIVSMVICGAPLASASLLGALPVVGASLKPMISPAERVALSEVQARYTTIKDDQQALVISGTAENVSSGTLGAVQIEAALVGPTRQMLRVEAVYCGNKLPQKMIGEMTPRELQFFEKLSAPKGFTLASQTSAPFVIVFISPPADASRFQLRVTKADTAAAAPAPPSAG